MKKDDYKTEFEEQRQEIDINEENDNGEIPSRVDLHSKARESKKRSGPKLVNILFALFPLIPVGILIFVIFSWDSPKEKQVEGVEDSQFQFETSDKDNQEKEIVEDEKNKEKEQKQEKEKQEALKKEELAKQEAEELAKKEQAEAEEAQLKKEQAEAEAKKAKEEQAKKEEQNKPAPKTHTVAAGETLYRISVNYYKSGDGVSKIMQANGLSSNEISTGQKLIIP